MAFPFRQRTARLSPTFAQISRLFTNKTETPANVNERGKEKERKDQWIQRRNRAVKHNRRIQHQPRGRQPNDEKWVEKRDKEKKWKDKERKTGYFESILVFFFAKEFLLVEKLHVQIMLHILRAFIPTMAYRVKGRRMIGAKEDGVRGGKGKRRVWGKTIKDGEKTHWLLRLASSPSVLRKWERWRGTFLERPYCRVPFSVSVPPAPSFHGSFLQSWRSYHQQAGQLTWKPVEQEENRSDDRKLEGKYGVRFVCDTMHCRPAK